MRLIDLDPVPIDADETYLKNLVVLDKHRPGPAYGRLRHEQIPVWAIIGYVEAIMEATGTSSVTMDVVARVARDYDVSPQAVLASLLYYNEHRHAINALLEENSAPFP